jgi:hypothetical protein
MTKQLMLAVRSEVHDLACTPYPPPEARRKRGVLQAAHCFTLLPFLCVLTIAQPLGVGTEICGRCTRIIQLLKCIFLECQPDANLITGSLVQLIPIA